MSNEPEMLELLRAIYGKVDGLEIRFGGLEGRMSSLEVRMGGLEDNVRKLLKMIPTENADFVVRH